MVNHPCEYHLDTSTHSSYMVLQTHIFYHKIISMGVVFRFFFFVQPCIGLVLHLKLSSYAYFLQISVTSQWIPQYNLYYSLPYTCTTSTAIFRFILSLKVTPECTLHSRVKDSITYISIVISSSKFKGGLLY